MPFQKKKLTPSSLMIKFNICICVDLAIGSHQSRDNYEQCNASYRSEVSYSLPKKKVKFLTQKISEVK